MGPVASAGTVQTANIPGAMEYGRVTNIEPIPANVAHSGGPSIPGAILGAVAGGVIGNQFGSGRGQGAAAVLGAAGGAALGSQIGRNATATTTMAQPGFRVTVQSQSGGVRYYDVPAVNDLRVGDLVQVRNGAIYRS